MATPAIKNNTVIIAPAQALQGMVSHYWLSLDNVELTHAALPDGAVDIVYEVGSCSARSWVYGTTTRRIDIPLEQHVHYLGIRFRPGQSRHFINVAAHELTDGHALTQGLLRCTLENVSEHIADGDVGELLNRLLGQHLARLQPMRSPIDEAIDLIATSHGSRPVGDIAAYCGKSHRQFERLFLEAVGVPAKRFSSIARFQHVTSLLTQGATLADAAATAGYTDQSHMSHEFKRLAGVSPGQFVGKHVDFLQDWRGPDRKNGRSD